MLFLKMQTNKKELKTECKKCIRLEVDHSCKANPSIIDILWCRYFRPETNSVYLIRKYLYYSELSSYRRGGGYRVLARYFLVVLMRRYGIFIQPGAKIGIGLHIIHPSGIFITKCRIGKNFCVGQNCTVGVKSYGSSVYGTTIGNDVTMCANSSIIGDLNIDSRVTLGAHSCLLHDTEGPGVYVGVPAKLIKRYVEG